MVRIPEEELARLKAEVPLERLVVAAGVVLGRHGRDLVGLCPFHADREPSLVVSPGKNLWHCLGACQAGGSVIDWVMRAEAVSFRHAVELLRAGHTGSSVSSAERSTMRRLAPPVDLSAGDAELLGQVVAFYHATLTEAPEALSYLARRRIDDGDAITQFQLGYANRTLGYRLPAKNRREGAGLRARLQAVGVLRASGHEHFTGSLVVPVVNDGVVREVYGRKVRDDLRAGTPVHLYLPGPHRGVWNVEALAAGEVIVCESLIDALSLWCAGFRNVTAAYGIEGFTAEHHDVFAAAGVRRVLVAYDRDDAGDRAARTLAEVLVARGVECFRVELPHGADVNDVAVAATDPAVALGRVLRSATWMGGSAGPTNQPPPAAAGGDVEPPTVDGAAPPSSSFAASAAAAPVVSPVPAPPEPGPQPAGDGDELRLVIGERRWRVRGLARATSFDLLRVNVFVAVGEGDGHGFHVDTLDLYSARSRSVFVRQAATELSVDETVIRRDLGRVLLAAETAAEDAIRAAQAPKAPEEVVLTDAERAAAMDLLCAADLAGRIVADMARAGVVGEATNLLVGYLAAVSRKLDTPLAVIVQSTSAAGKSALMEAVLAMVPPEDRVSYSAMTGQSLFYMGEADLAHRVLAVAEQEGAERAAYALKLLQSEGGLSIASTGKDPATGRLVTHTYSVSGPTAIFLTTTAVDVDEELLNRCVVLTVDEDRDQTRAIHHAQRARQTLEGLLADQVRARIVKQHQDAQRLLRPLLVANPHAPRLTFADERTRTRRDHVKYLTLIQAVALLHQHQRPKRTLVHEGRPVVYIEATVDDIALANRLAHDVLGRSLDELAPQTRRLLDIVTALVAEGCAVQEVERTEFRFGRRDVRAACGWSDFQVRTHLGRLVDLEYVLVHKGGRGQCFVYELLHDGGGEDGRRWLPGLTDPATLDGYDPDTEGSTARFEPPSSPQRVPIEGPSRGNRNGTRPAGPTLPEDSGSVERVTGDAADPVVVTRVG